MVNIIIGFVNAVDLVSDGLANLSPRTWQPGSITQTETEQRSPVTVQPDTTCLSSLLICLHLVEEKWKYFALLVVSVLRSNHGSTTTG